MLLCDPCSNQLIAEMKMMRDKKEEFAGYEHTLRAVDWGRIWDYERKKSGEMK
jgi:hypothetical protein